MSFQEIIFYALSAILLFAAVRVVTASSPVNAALNLVLAFFTAAGHWLLLQSEFLAIVLVLVYVGAVMVLFLFVVMMLDINLEELRRGFWSHLPVAAVVASLMIIEMVLILAAPETNLKGYAEPAAIAADFSNVKQLGRLIYTTYVYPFELAAVVLLVGIVAAIALTQRQRKDTKWVDPAKQVVVSREGRVKLIKMQAVVRQPDSEADSTNDTAA